MNIHEYQAKKFLSQKGLPIPPFGVASDLKQAQQIVQELGLNQAVLKVQIHAGGRGKAGGVKFAKNPEEIFSIFQELLGKKIVTPQTGKEGVIVKRILLTKPVDIEKEYYLSFLIDRKKASPMLIASQEGGVEIEEIAKKMPEKILKIPFDLSGRLHSYQLLRFVKFMGFEGKLAEVAKQMVQTLALAFLEMDASLLEINPLVKTSEGKLWLLDAKVSIDDNALFRHSEIAACYDPSQISPAEAAANEYGLAYLSMGGNIGCMVNGAGLAMATMDILKLYGGSPANFLDVGGGASQEKVAAGFRIILSDPQVKVVFVHIFGGIMNCETLAQGILQAAKELQLQIPLVVRMEGTNVEKGRSLLASSPLRIYTAPQLEEAAKLAVQVAKHGHLDQ